MQKSKRKTKQYLLPVEKKKRDIEAYDVYPSFTLPSGKIYTGMEGVVQYILEHKTVVVDGNVGVFWEIIINGIKDLIPDDQVVNIIKTESGLLCKEDIDKLVKPYIGEYGTVWGKKCDIELKEFFDKDFFKEALPDPNSDINIIVGVGAALSHWKAPLFYVELPKNEMRYRLRAKSITNLGAEKPDIVSEMYKRFYYVDWFILKRHKEAIFDRIELVIDSQRGDNFTWAFFSDIRKGLDKMSRTVFRVRPWVDPGVWGGEWIKDNIDGFSPEEVNYAWSLELMPKENGLLFESDSLLLEVPFDFLMYRNNRAVLGEDYYREFGLEFPIRYNYLDTIKGGNLSVQCHPGTNYVRDNFGEKHTQNETYYVLDAEEKAVVYLGFQEDINPDEFRIQLENSQKTNQAIDVEKYVQKFPSKKHDYFLIPNGTVHSSGAGNMVLEISAYPYIYTFKMYDWVRLDLDGKPRPINIEHAYNNLNFDLRGDTVENELIVKPEVISEQKGLRVEHLSTHAEHFYDVHRYIFEDEVEIETKGSCQVLMLVEGDKVSVKTDQSSDHCFYYAETFVVPAATKKYVLKNEGKGKAVVLKTFLK